MTKESKLVLLEQDVRKREKVITKKERVYKDVIKHK